MTRETSRGKLTAQNEDGLSFDVFSQSRYIGFASIAVAIVGVGFALFFLSMTSGWFQIQSILALTALWVANLISTVLNAVYWWMRRGPKGLVILLGIQCVIVLAGPIFNMLQD